MGAKTNGFISSGLSDEALNSLMIGGAGTRNVYKYIVSDVFVGSALPVASMNGMGCEEKKM